MIYQGLKLKRTWIEINLDKLSFNLSEIKKHLDPKCKIMGVVKADAYGHGDKIIAEHLIDCGADFLGVSNIEEALSLRRFGVKIPILILGYTPPSLAPTLAQYNITQTIYDFDYAKQLSENAKKENISVDVHIKIETGMNRIGFNISDDNFSELLNIYKLPHLNPCGIFTHFSVSDGNSKSDEEYTFNQFNSFINICDRLSSLGIKVGLRHCSNSAATIRYPHMHLDMVRPGIILYGPYIDDCKNFLPVMTLKTKISMIKNIGPNSYIGYGRTFMSNHPMKIATICIGYADGLNRMLSNVGKVSINGKIANIVGNICMDQTMIDVSHIDDVSEGDEVILWGNETCNLNDIASSIKNIPYELLCNISKRVPRLYIKDNKEYLFVDYIASI